MFSLLARLYLVLVARTNGCVRPSTSFSIFVPLCRLPPVGRSLSWPLFLLSATCTQDYDVEVTAFILARSVVVGLSLDGDRTKRCSNGEMTAYRLPSRRSAAVGQERG